MLSRVYSRVTFIRRPRLAWPCSRYLQAAATQQALLEPLDSHPGISCLSLNRPLSKNAISTILLQVNQPASVISYRLVHIIVSYSNSEKALKSFIATRGKTTSISMDTTSDIDHLQPQRSRFDSALYHDWIILCWCRSFRKADDVSSSSREILGRLARYFRKTGVSSYAHYCRYRWASFGGWSGTKSCV